MQGRLTESDQLDFFPAETWREEFKIAKEIGFNAIEWGFATTHWENNPILSRTGRRDIRRLIKDSNIPIPSVCGYYFADNGFTGKDAKEHARVLTNLIASSADIGANRIIIPFLGQNDIKSEKQKEEILIRLQPCLALAKKYNVEIAFETVLPAIELNAWIRRFNNPYVKVCYDIGNCTAVFGNSVPEEIKILGDLITSVHIKDKKFGARDTLILGNGDTDFEGIFVSLKEINFGGTLILEAARSNIIDCVTLNKIYLCFIKPLLSGGRNE